MKDPLTKRERSALMAKVRSKRNRSTEGFVHMALARGQIKGWNKQRSDIFGSPDFYFPRHRLALFVHGCFWHACGRCGRIPKTNVAFWQKKIRQNQRRDRLVARRLRKAGYSVMWVWEHELRTSHWLKRLRSKLKSNRRVPVKGKSLRK